MSVDAATADKLVSTAIRVEARGAGASVVVEGASTRAMPAAKASAWTAALTAATWAQQSTRSTEFFVKTGPDVDGTSTGMLTTTTLLALLRGEAVKTDVTISGAINPDGTSGPVAGLAQKLTAAAAGGKKVFGYPLGTRQVEDTSGAVVDVEAVAAALGVQAVEVKNVRDAYLLLTGVDLGVRPGVDIATLRGASAELRESLNIRVDMWRASAESSFARVQPILNALTPEVRESIAWVYAPIFQAVKQATAYEKAEQLLAAEQKWMEVSIATAAAEDELAILEAGRLGKLEQAFAVLLPYLELEEQAATMMADVGEALKSGGTTVGAVDAVLAADSVVQSLALVGAGKRGLQAAVDTIKQLEAGGTAANKERIDQFLLHLLKTAPVLARAETTLAAARMDLAFAAVEAGSPLPNVDRLGVLTTTYVAAASAGGASFSAFIGLDELSSPSFTFAEPAWATAAWAPELATSWSARATEADQVLGLAASTQAWLSASSLQNQYEALGYRDGVVARQPALAAQLMAARELALSSLQDVSTSIPPRMSLDFIRAEELSRGSDDDKIDALGAYWRTTFAAGLLAELDRPPPAPVVVEPPPSPRDLEPVVKKPAKPQKKLPIRKPPPKKTVKPIKKK